MMCLDCGGKGWQWAGVADGEAERVECEPCAGTGEERPYTWMLILALASWALVLGLIWFSTMRMQVTLIVN